jgi:catechol 2,3-dioxygenase
MSATTGSRREPATIAPDTSMGAVRLTVPDVERSRAFYERAIGFRGAELDDGGVALGVAGEPPLVELHGDAAAPPLDRRAPGLFHLAILLPDRRELARALARLAQARTPLSGASDHLVSEALYLSDPDGNGIELYRDRPREEWPVRDGALQMATLPLDLDSVIGELRDSDDLSPVAPAGTRMGHVHLQVSDVAEAERFYSDVLGFEVTVRGSPGALFVSAGGDHHLLGLNTGHSAGSPPAPSGALGLRSFEVVLADEAERERVLARVRTAGLEPVAVPSGWLVPDPFGNAVVLRTR